MSSEQRTNAFATANSDPLSDYVHEIWLYNKRQPIIGYSEKDLDKKAPFAPYTWMNFHNYFIRLMAGPHSPYYPGHRRGVSQVVFFDNRNDNMVCRVTKGAIQWGTGFLLDENWKTVIPRLEDVIEKLTALGDDPTQEQLYTVKKRYSYSQKGAELKFDCKDLSQRWATLKSLGNYCRLLKESGFAEGEILHYYNSYKEKYSL